MQYNRRTRLAAALIGGAAALTIGGLTAAPAGAVNLADYKHFTLTLGSGKSATVKVCYELDPTNNDVDEDVHFTEKVQIWGDDQHDTVKSKDDPLPTIYSGSRVFHDTTPIKDICRTKTFSDRKKLNDDSGPGKDELYAKITLVPDDQSLNTASKRSNEIKIHL